MQALRMNVGSIHPDISHYAKLNAGYAVWLAKVAALCERFLNIELMGLIESEGIDPIEFYKDNVHPDHYFVRVVVPAVENEYIEESIDEIIGLEAMWGNSSY